jgi:hypothetical protein
LSPKSREVAVTKSSDKTPNSGGNTGKTNIGTAAVAEQHRGMQELVLDVLSNKEFGGTDENWWSYLSVKLTFAAQLHAQDQNGPERRTHTNDRGS